MNNKTVKIPNIVYEMLVELSKKPKITPELFLEALIRKYHAEKK
jgi:hypothetical protein